MESVFVTDFLNKSDYILYIILLFVLLIQYYFGLFFLQLYNNYNFIVVSCSAAMFCPTGFVLHHVNLFLKNAYS